jgi:5-methyltetrahydropteroyltriglutamate--homocysteine methyltransferase
MQATVVGNFPKIGDSFEKQKLRRAIEAYQQGKLSEDELKKIEDEITKEVIQIQVDAGIQLITDGQIRWQDPITWIARKLKGIVIGGLIRFFDNNVYYRQPIVESAIGWEEPILVEDYKFARLNTPKHVKVKAVLPGPYTLARLSKNNHYGRFEDLVYDYARVLAKEAKALEEAGADFIQFDEPSLCQHPENFQMTAKALEVCTTPLLHATVAVYFYFGNTSRLYSVLSSLPAQVLGLDLVSDPETAKLVQEKPFKKDLALGLVDARNTKMEKLEDLERFLKSCEKNWDKIKYINPSCGLEFLPYNTAVEKLNLVGDLCAMHAVV